MGRSHRSGRRYATPTAPARKRKAKDEASAGESQGAVTPVSNIVSDEGNGLTFGSVPPSPSAGALILAPEGVRRLRGYGLAGAPGVRLSPSVYAAIYQRTPKVASSVRLRTNRPDDPHPEVDAQEEAETMHGPEAADHAL